MDRKTRTILIIGSIVTFVIVPAVTMFVVSYFSQKPQEQTTSVSTSSTDRSNDDFIAVITSKNSDLVSDNKPTFSIMDVVKPQNGWYIVTIRDSSDTNGTNPAKILFQDTGNTKPGLSILLGPGTSFPSDVTEPLGIPEAVLKELNK